MPVKSGSGVPLSCTRAERLCCQSPNSYRVTHPSRDLQRVFYLGRSKSQRLVVKQEIVALSASHTLDSPPRQTVNANRAISDTILR